MVIFGNEEEIELFEGFFLFIFGSEWVARWVTFVSFQGVSADIVGAAAETKNSLCFTLLR